MLCGHWPLHKLTRNYFRLFPWEPGYLGRPPGASTLQFLLLSTQKTKLV